MKRTKHFVLDANTLVSAFLLSSTSIAARAYYKAISEGKIVASEEVIDEFSAVFIRPKFDRYLELEKRLIIIEDLKAVIKILPVISNIKACRDPKDDKYLALAVSSAAECIVTGDKDLLVLNPFQNIPILTAADFLEQF
ncbi:putative toxin-antitoxin system toxin component, PIN family [Mucilaginibacter sp. BJC16-A38]|uniref:putative toxin-antitoxin system toxin component, PIN family n=1 Tax=Mucilaginibacter phenanthrenivorans TaxID=1234842 RepID=UPI0021574FB1|nr:putative toxin-antitoxin system toxin component, PIN family [Mucilaginibacter phenanthrenivorans]MCR8560977.1 putative toxin-antitoxin system toxin component, PIN family [Mucilaginibacter phenanthrenivorans]